jgi:hypothetical protein
VQCAWAVLLCSRQKECCVASMHDLNRTHAHNTSSDMQFEFNSKVFHLLSLSRPFLLPLSHYISSPKVEKVLRAYLHDEWLRRHDRDVSTLPEHLQERVRVPRLFSLFLHSVHRVGSAIGFFQMGKKRKKTTL